MRRRTKKHTKNVRHAKISEMESRKWLEMKGGLEGDELRAWNSSGRFKIEVKVS